MKSLWAVLLASLLALASCAENPIGTDPMCADVVAALATESADGSFRFEVTVRSDETGWDAYADRWEVVVDGAVVARRVLAHPHVEEQPFTRHLDGVTLTPGTDRVTIRAHHNTGGFCGEPLQVDI